MKIINYHAFNIYINKIKKFSLLKYLHQFLYSVFSVFLIVFFVGCTQEIPLKKIKKINPDFEKFSWLIGKWSAVTAKSHYQETWVKKNDSTLTGKAFMLSKTDTVFTEILEINISKKGIHYLATVPDQNNGKPVQFYITKHERGLHIFENKNHDFPQKIMYFMKNPTQLLATASGIENGKFRKEDFVLRKSDAN